MGATIAEKILARAAARDRVTPGEYIWATPDLTVAHDRDYPRYRQRMKAVGLHKIAAAAKLVVSIDHRPYSNDAREIETRAWTRNDIKEQGVGTFFDLGRNGISHNITVDHGMVRPGMLVITADTRSPALGCVGALGIANGSGFIVTLYTGKTWLQVPHTIKVTVSGQARPGVLSRDISTHIIGTIGGSKADYRVLEFSGTAMEAMSVEERHTLCNAMVDIGVKGAIVVPDKVTAEYCRRFPYPRRTLSSPATRMRISSPSFISTSARWSHKFHVRPNPKTSHRYPKSPVRKSTRLSSAVAWAEKSTTCGRQPRYCAGTRLHRACASSSSPQPTSPISRRSKKA